MQARVEGELERATITIECDCGKLLLRQGPTNVARFVARRVGDRIDCAAGEGRDGCGSYGNPADLVLRAVRLREAAPE